MGAASDSFELTEGAPVGPGAAAALIAETEADETRRAYLLVPAAGPARR